VAYLNGSGEPKPREEGKPGPWSGKTTLHLWDMNPAKERRLDFVMDQILYSSRGWQPLAGHEWDAEGTRLTITYQDAGRKRVTLDAATGEIVAREDLPELPPFVREFPPGISTDLKPEWEALKDFGGDEEQRLGHALLKHAGIVYERPRDWSGSSIGLSTDGKRFLMALHRGGVKDFFLGDLSTLECRRIPRPARLERATFRIQAVPAP
jgi:hypothetical protein